ncbi:MAG: amidohydrolase/deacetylase family metallohydrolase [Flavobacteriaceae bacterium]|jgi:dihydroorotase|nr:amidohydrolase/deacetylase family metallohydrolase [Flavobacteriaceae bacterium]
MKKIKLIICIVGFSLFQLKSYTQVYDILIKNGHVIDAKNNLNKIIDIAIVDNKIALIQKNISINSALIIIDANGLYVSPGLIDIHSHNFHGTEPNNYLSNSFDALPPDGFSFRSGVTTIVDVGGAGWRNFKTFKEQIIDRSKTRVLSFLNIIGSGMKGGAVEQNLSDMEPSKTVETVNKFPNEIVGIKLAHFNGYNWIPVDRVVEAGRLANVPVMIDFGGSDPELPLDKLLLEKLRPGDIFTHAYAHVRGRTPIVDKNGKLREYVLEAQRKGIVFDVGHGGGSFLFEQAIPAIKQGLKPNSISTDLHTGSMNGGMKNIVNVMSKFLNMGIEIDEIIKLTTWNPAKYIKRTDLGHLSVGAEADITLLNLRKGDFGFIDTQGKRMKGNNLLECELTIKAGKIVYDLNGLASNEWRKK